ncbi:HD domain-containing phosphohydrolase [Pseudomonas sp. NPDC047963]|nr:response regulator [Pseudomonas sp.]
MLPDALRFARIVAVDDQPANLRLIQTSLRAFGAREVEVFTDSAAALQWLQGNPWDLLLLDLDMPTPNGFDILRELQSRDRCCQPIIIVTAMTDAENRRRGLELGANDYLSKPLDLAELLLRVRNTLQLGMASQALARERDDLERTVKARTRELEDSFHAVIRGLSRAAEYKDNETGNHILRIGETAALMASALGCAPRWVELLRLAAPMHDVGKIGIPDSILLKPGPLTAAERELMNRHARIGHDILRDQTRSPLLDMAAEVALNHHERWDGGGYPNSLQGEAIPLSARIVTLCDVYDALRSKRPYKEAWPVERARAHIQEQAGKQFDPKLVALLESLYDEIEALREGLTDPSMAGEGACAASQQPVLSNR